jgi:hypothetical protein
LAEQALAHVGGVGADHQQFAVRHVDDAHQAEGDGQAQRRQQQHAAQRDAVENLAGQFGPANAAVDLAQGGVGCHAHRHIGLRITAVGIAGGQGAQLLAHGRVAALRKRANGGLAYGGIGGLQFGACHQRQQDFAHGRVLLLRQCLAQQRGLRQLDAAALQVQCRGQARFTLRRQQRQAGQGLF